MDVYNLSVVRIDNDACKEIKHHMSILPSTQNLLGTITYSLSNVISSGFDVLLILFLPENLLFSKRVLLLFKELMDIQDQELNQQKEIMERLSKKLLLVYWRY